MVTATVPAAADRGRMAAVPNRPRREIRQPGAYQFVLGAYAAPIARVAPGETVAVETADCFDGRLTREDQVPSRVRRDGDRSAEPTGTVAIQQMGSLTRCATAMRP